MKTLITLIRHGETNWNVEGRWQGDYDVPLNDKGRSQAAQTIPFLSQANFTRIISSDLQRARETAEIINATLNLPLSVDARLREVNVGMWEGLTVPEIRAQYAELYAKISELPYHESYFPGGESRQQLMQRSGAVLTDIATQYTGENILVASHGGTIRAALLYLAQHELSDKIENCTLSRLIYTNPAWRVEWAGLNADKIVW